MVANPENASASVPKPGRELSGTCLSEAGHPHEQSTAAAVRGDRGRDELARLRLHGSNSVLEVEDERTRRQLGHLCELPRVGARHEQHRAQHAAHGAALPHKLGS